MTATKVELVNKSVSANFRVEVLSAAESVGRSEQVAVNFYLLFAEATTGKPARKSGEPEPAVTCLKMSQLRFYALFDATIPLAYGQNGTVERKEVESHVTLNRLRRLQELGKRIYQGRKVPVDSDTRKKATTLRCRLEANWAVANGVSMAAMESWFGMENAKGKALHPSSDAYLSALGAAMVKAMAAKKGGKANTDAMKANGKANGKSKVA